MYYMDSDGIREKINIFTNLPLSIMNQDLPDGGGWHGEASLLFL